MTSQPILKYERRGSSEWYTPEAWFERVRAALGGTIGLDAASCIEAQRTVRAERFFTPMMNALALDWKAPSVFLNPPGTKYQNIWTKKLVDEYHKGHFEQAVFLMFKVATDTKWYHYLMDHAAVICFTKGRIKFAAPEGTYEDSTKSSPPVAQAFVYLGKDPSLFIEHFKDTGTMMQVMK